MNDEIEDMKLEIEDRDGQLLELQREEAVVQASVIGTPKRVCPSRRTITEWISHCR